MFLFVLFEILIEYIPVVLANKYAGWGEPGVPLLSDKGVSLTKYFLLNQMENYILSVNLTKYNLLAGVMNNIVGQAVINADFWNKKMH